MTIEQRKEKLMSWISSIQSEKLIEQIEDFRNNPEPEIPDTILELLKKSTQSSIEDCQEHTSSRELLGR